MKKVNKAVLITTILLNLEIGSFQDKWDAEIKTCIKILSFFEHIILH